MLNVASNLASMQIIPVSSQTANVNAGAGCLVGRIDPDGSLGLDTDFNVEMLSFACLLDYIQSVKPYISIFIFDLISFYPFLSGQIFDSSCIII